MPFAEICEAAPAFCAKILRYAGDKAKAHGPAFPLPFNNKRISSLKAAPQLLDRAMAEQLTMDRIDRQLLNLLQTDARRTARSLSEAVPISAAAIRRRIRRLRNAGIIKREVAVLDRHFRDQRVESVLLVRLRTAPSEAPLAAPSAKATNGTATISASQP